jgi:hypothetical protein
MGFWPQQLNGGSGGSGANPQVPSGTIDGTNTTFDYTGTLNNLFLNGAFQTPNVDYTASTGVISFTVAPVKGSVLYAT